eukprot:448700-Pyramimonas_sp.AAC.2
MRHGCRTGLLSKLEEVDPGRGVVYRAQGPSYRAAGKKLPCPHGRVVSVTTMSSWGPRGTPRGPLGGPASRGLE